MRLYTKCSRCENEIGFFSWETDRVELSMRKGDELELQCRACPHIANYHLNSIYAKRDRFSLFIGLIVAIIGIISTIILVMNFVFRTTSVYAIVAIAQVIGLPMLVYTISNNDQEKKISRFNRIRIPNEKTNH